MQFRRKFNCKEAGFAIYLFLLANTVLRTSYAKSTYSNINTPCEENYGRPSKFKYEDGKTYVYDYKSNVISKIVGTSNESTGFQLTGSVHLTVSQGCDSILTLSNVRILTSTNNEQAGGILEWSSIRFFWNRDRGDIDLVRLHPDDETWSANVKRAVVFLFNGLAYNKNSGESESFEEDVAGRNCPTKSSMDGDVVTKKRNLNACRDRDGGAFPNFGVPFGQYGDALWSNGFFKSDQTCVQNFTSGLLQSAECSELHKLVPFSLGESGAQTEIKVLLFLKEIRGGAPSLELINSLSKESRIIFDHDDSNSNKKRNKENSKEILRTITTALCAALNDSTSTTVTLALNSDLTKALRSANDQDMLDLANEISEGQICFDDNQKLLNLYFDAAIMAGTSDATKFAVTFNDGKLLSRRSGLFTFYSLFLEKPKSDVIAALTRIILDKSVDSQLILAASSYAKQYSKALNSSVPYNDISNALVDAIAQHAIPVTTMDAESSSRQIVAFQALGNIPSLTDRAINAILAGMKQSGRLRINALQAFRSNPCQKHLNNEVKNLFSDFSLPADVRIHAYLAITRCIPTGYVYDTTDFISRILKSEPSKQVLLFINSHIRNENRLQEYKPSWERQRFLNYVDFPRNIHQDNSLKFSKNFMNSAYNAVSGIRHDLHGNVIYSTDSYIPRTLEGKIALDFYGSSYQLAEVGVNLEGFDNLFERLFGPKGGLRNLVSKKPNSSLVKRHESDETQTLLDNFIDQIYHEPKSPSSRKPVADAHMRVFGTTIFVSNYDEPEALLENLEFSKSYLTKALLQSASSLINWEKLIPVGYQVNIPTMSGFPLQISIGGSGLNTLKLETKSTRVELDGSVGAIVKGHLLIGNGPVHTGIRLEQELKLSPGFWAEKSSSPTEHSLSFGIPTNRDQVAGFKSQLYWSERFGDTDDSYTNTNIKSNNSRVNPSRPPICSHALEKMTGLKVCSTIETPMGNIFTPSFPLNGDTLLLAKLHKTGQSGQSFVVKLKTSGLRGKLPNAEGFVSIQVNTPNSASPLQADLNFKMKSQYYESNLTKDMSLLVKLDSTWKNLEVNLMSSKNPSNQSYEVKMKKGNQELGIRGYKKLKSQNVEQIGDGEKKMSEINEYDLSIYSSSGYSSILSAETLNNFNADESENEIEGSSTSGGLSLNVDMPAIYYAKGNISTIWETSRVGDELVFSINELKGTCKDFGTIVVNGSANISRNFRKASLQIDANFGKKSENDFSVKHSYDFTTPGKPSLQIQAVSNVPKLNFEGEFSADCQSETKAIHLLADHKASAFYISQNSKYASRNETIVIKNDIEVTWPYFGLELHAISDSKLPSPEGQYLTFAEIKTETNSGSGASVDFKCGPSLTYEITTRVQCEKMKAKFYSNLERVNSSQLNLNIYSTYQIPSREHPSVSTLNATLNGLDYSKGYKLTALLDSSRIHNPVRIESEYKKADPDSKYRLKVEKVSLNITQSDKSIFNILLDQLPPSDDYRGLVLFQSSLRNVFDTDCKIKHPVRITKKPFKLTFNFDWLPTGRKIVHNFTAEAPDDDIGPIVGDLQWDARRDLTKAIGYNFTATLKKLEQTRLTLRLYMVTTGIVGKSWRYWLTGVDLEYISPENKVYGAGVHTDFTFNETTRAGIINVTAKLSDQEVVLMPLEIGLYEFNTTSREFDFKIKYEPRTTAEPKIIESRTYPSLRVNINSKVADDGVRRIAASYYEGGIYYVVPVNITLETSVGTKLYRLALTSSQENQTSAEISLDLNPKFGKNSISLTTIYEKRDVKNVKQPSGFNSVLDVRYDIKWGTSFEVEVKEALRWNREHFEFNQLVNVSNKIIQFEGSTVNGKSVDPIYSIQAGAHESGEDGRVLNCFVNFTHNGFILFPEEITVLAPLRQRQTFIEIAFTPQYSQPLLNITAKFPSDVFRSLEFSANSNLSSNPKTAAFALAINEDPEKKLKIDYFTSPKAPPLIEANLQWGNETEQVSAVGSVKSTTSGQSIELLFNGPGIKDEWSVVLSNDVENRNPMYSFEATSSGSKDSVFANVVAGLSDRGDIKDLSGAWKINIKGLRSDIPSKGEFKVDLPIGTADLKFYAASQVLQGDSIVPIVLTAIISNPRSHAVASLCLNSKCRVADVHINSSRTGSKFLATYTNRNAPEIGGFKTYGAQFDSSMDRGVFDALVKFFVEAQPSADTEKLARNLGVRVFKTKISPLSPGDSPSEDATFDIDSVNFLKELVLGIHLFLPRRVIATEAAVGRGTLRPAIGYDLKFWLNKDKEPAQNLTILFSMKYPNPRGNSYKLIAQHPTFDRDMTISAMTSRDEPSYECPSVNFQFDVFNDRADRISLVADCTKKSETLRTSSMELKGLGISLIHYCLSEDFNGPSDCKFQFRDTKSKVEKELNWKISLDSEDSNGGRLIQIGNVESPIFLWKIYRAPDRSDRRKSREFRIIGMNDSIIFSSGVHDRPNRVYFQSALSENQFEEFSELSLSYQSKTLTLPLTFNEASGTHLLTNFVAAKNNTGLLFYKFQWENETIHKYLAKAKEHLEQTRIGMNKALLAASNDLAEIENSLVSRFHASRSKFTSMSNSISNQIKQLKHELFYEGTRNLSHLKSAKTDKESDVTISAPTKRNSFLIVDWSFKALEAFLNGIGSISSFLSSRRPGISPAVPIPESIRIGYRKIQSAVGNTLNRLQELDTLFRNRISNVDRTYLGSTGSKIVGLIKGRMKRNIFAKYDRIYRTLEEDIILLFPYNETHEFLQSFNDYTISRILDENRNNSAELKALVNKFSSALSKGVSEVFKADYQSGIISTQIPLFPLTKSWKIFFTPKAPSLWPKLPCSLKEFLPPANAYGVLIGSHFITFDGEIGVINSECNYLLAADLVDRNFSITANIKYDTEDRSLSATNIFLATKEAIVNFDRGSKPPKITVVNRKELQSITNMIEPELERKLQWNVLGPKTTNDPTNWVVIKNSNAQEIEIICSILKDTDICIVRLSGYYHGKVKGLLGVFNNEPNDDFTIPSGKIVHGNATFSRHWNVARTCKQTEKIDENIGAPVWNCEAIAKKASPHKPCFSTIDPQSYVRMCEVLMINTNYEPEKALCSASFAYAKVCEDSGIRVDDLPGCSLEVERYNYYHY